MAGGLGGVGGVRLIALLNFYDEPLDILEACVGSLAFCDQVVALDGAYALFPAGQEFSPPGSTALLLKHGAIYGTCFGKTEVEKRNRLLDIGKQIASEEDWFLVIDADMVVTSVPSNLKHVLENTDCDVGTYWLKDPVYGGRHPIRYLFRAADDLYIKTTHYGYRRGDTWLWEHGGLPAVETDLIIEHRGHLRSKERNARADEYDRLVQVHGIENAS